jgi:hypothetical protein
MRRPFSFSLRGPAVPSVVRGVAHICIVSGSLAPSDCSDALCPSAQPSCRFPLTVAADDPSCSAHIDDPEPVASVRGVDGASWHNKRPRGVILGFQVSKHLVETQGNVTINIFENAKSGSFVCNNLANERPDVAVILCASLLSGDTKGLAGIAR